ncbi:AAA family ATPase (plasmid) [Embleya sp. NBC_00888]|uniref:helix-turn-helix transcriptional regulator n=1 Tax=Embleya sp. NBC_00888 TaxID=2975960 RepID=UPI002F90CD60|nr:AAA family ATPase [Embleya sp. NBC_00888]
MTSTPRSGSTDASRARLWGREVERAEIAAVIARARLGRSAVLVLRGPAGIGKSTLLDGAARDADGLRVLRAAGVVAEAGLPFAALHGLLRPVLHRLDTLPDVQVAALRGALGLAQAGPDRYLVGSAVLGLLSDLSRERPLLCLIDDAHWLDVASAEVLLFIARRLDAEGVGMLFTARDAPEGFPARALPELTLSALEHDPAGALLAERVPDLTPAVRERIIAESAGNPLALLEFAAGLDADVRTGRVDPPTALPVTDRVSAAFGDRIARLPEPARVVLTVAAAEGTGDLGTVLRAARALGAGAEDLDACVAAGLLRGTGATIAFRHPLVRSTAYQRAGVAGRLAVHRALAAATDGERRLWHLAEAAAGPDESVAAALERAGVDAHERGATGAAAPIHERAARLSPEPADRARRSVLAAQMAVVAGRTEHAAELADRALAGTEDPLPRAGSAMVRATAASERGTPRGAARLLIEHARPIAPTHPELALRLLIMAAGIAWSAAEEVELRELAALAAESESAAAASVEHASAEHASPAAAITALAYLVDDDPERALPILRSFVTGVRVNPPGLLLTRILAGNLAVLLGDDDAALDLSTTDAARTRVRGQVGALPGALQVQAHAQAMAGLPHDAAATIAEALTFARDTGQVYRVARLHLITARIAAERGDEDGCRAALAADADLAGAPAFGGVAETTAAADCVLALLDLTLGRHESAVRRLTECTRGPARHTAAAVAANADLVEAAVRAGTPERAREAAARFERWARASGTPWAMAVALRCGALLAEPDAADALYVAAIREHERGGRPFERARTELLHGEWLRRARRRVDARAPLRSALAGFERSAASPWAERARSELRATGDAAPADTGDADVLARLTPQELHIVRLAAEGVSNRDIASRLFLSPRTVEYHLYKAYPKLGIGSRGELSRFRTSRC